MPRKYTRNYMGQSAAETWLKSNPKKIIFGRIEPSGKVFRYRFNPEVGRIEIGSGKIGKSSPDGWANAKSWNRATKFFESAPASYMRRRRSYTRRQVAETETRQRSLGDLLAQLKDVVEQLLKRL